MDVRHWGDIGATTAPTANRPNAPQGSSSAIYASQPTKTRLRFMLQIDGVTRPAAGCAARLPCAVRSQQCHGRPLPGARGGAGMNRRGGAGMNWG